MEKTGMIGVDPGKRSFRLCGVREDGAAMFRKKVSRERLIAAESAERQGEAMLFRTRDLPFRQRTRTADALGGRPAEHGVAAPQRIANVARLAEAVDDPKTRLPETVRDLGRELLERIGILDAKIGKLDAEARKRAKESGEARRLMAIPGISPVCAMAIQTFAPPIEGFRRGRDHRGGAEVNAGSRGRGLAPADFSLRRDLSSAYRLWRREDDFLKFPTSALYEVQFVADARKPGTCLLITSDGMEQQQRKPAQALLAHTGANISRLARTLPA